MGVKPGVPGVLPASGPPNALYALGLAFAPAWLLPGSSDVPAAGVIAATPLSPLCASALSTPSPTIGQRNGAAPAAPAVPRAKVVTVNKTAMRFRMEPPLRFESWGRESRQPDPA